MAIRESSETPKAINKNNGKNRGKTLLGMREGGGSMDSRNERVGTMHGSYESPLGAYTSRENLHNESIK